VKVKGTSVKKFVLIELPLIDLIFKNEIMEWNAKTKNWHLTSGRTES